MRFGIMNMQLGGLLPADALPDQVLARLAKLNQLDLVQPLVDHGFTTIELGGDLKLFFPHIFDPAQIADLSRLKAKHGLRYTVHLPLWSVEPATPLTPVRDGAVRAIVEAITETLPLEPEIYVLHATGPLAAEFYRMRLPELARTLILHRFQAAARQSLRTILDETGIASRRIAIETIEFPFDLTLELAEELDLSVCFDTGHILAGFSGPIDFWDALERCLPRLGEIHLHDAPQCTHDNPGYGQDHQPLGAGDLHVGELLDRLEAAQFAGPIVLELQLDQALRSLDAIRSLRPRWLPTAL